MVNERFPSAAAYGFEKVDAEIMRCRCPLFWDNRKFTANPIAQIFCKFSDNCADRRNGGFSRDWYENDRLRDSIATG
jgi:hypothetical protein